MKFLVLFAVLFVAYLVWRAQRAADRHEAASHRPPPAIAQQEMVRCPVCSLHLPRNDALIGHSGRLYCCADHRIQGGN